MKKRENAKKCAITDFHSPNGSRDIPFQCQEFKDGHRYFVGLQPHVHVNVTSSQAQSGKTMKQ